MKAVARRPFPRWLALGLLLLAVGLVVVQGPGSRVEALGSRLLVPVQGALVRGRDLRSGAPRELEVTNAQIADAITGSVRAISDAVAETLEETPPELLADLMGRGITLAGGGALLPGLPELLARRVQMSVHVAEEPLGCVVRGTGRVLNELDTLRKVLLDLASPKPPRIP